MARNKSISKKGFRIFHLGIILMIVYVAFVMNHQRNLAIDLEDRKTTMENEIAHLESEIETLNKEIGMSGTLEFIEKIAREDLGMVKPREIIYVDKSNGNADAFEAFKGDN